MERRILTSTKATLNIGAADTSFDGVIVTHINSAFSTLHQLGVGPVEGFAIEDDQIEWDEFTSGNVLLNSVQTYVYLSVRLAFDPPSTGYGIDAAERQLAELTWRLKETAEPAPEEV